jgi:hypothetical protein
MFSDAAKQTAARLDLTMGRANLEEFADTLLELARADRNVIAVTSDSRGSGKLTLFRFKYGRTHANRNRITEWLNGWWKHAFIHQCLSQRDALRQVDFK